MDFTKLKEQQKAREEEIRKENEKESIALKWPDDYYKETDAKKRRTLLSQAM